MKKICSWFLITFLAIASLFAVDGNSFIDGKIVIASAGELPRGRFAKTYGYLPGDRLTVTNSSNNAVAEILNLGSLEKSGDVVMILSAELADFLGLKADSSVSVRLSRRQLNLDSVATGKAFVSEEKVAVTKNHESDEYYSEDYSQNSSLGFEDELSLLERPSPADLSERNEFTSDSGSERKEEVPVKNNPSGLDFPKTSDNSSEEPAEKESVLEEKSAEEVAEKKPELNKNSGKEDSGSSVAVLPKKFYYEEIAADDLPDDEPHGDEPGVDSVNVSYRKPEKKEEEAVADYLSSYRNEKKSEPLAALDALDSLQDDEGGSSENKAAAEEEKESQALKSAKKAAVHEEYASNDLKPLFKKLCHEEMVEEQNLPALKGTKKFEEPAEFVSLNSSSKKDSEIPLDEVAVDNFVDLVISSATGFEDVQAAPDDGSAVLPKEINVEEDSAAEAVVSDEEVSGEAEEMISSAEEDLEGETVVSDEHVFAEPEAQICDEDLSGESVIPNEEIHNEPGNIIKENYVDSKEHVTEEDSAAEAVVPGEEVSGEAEEMISSAEEDLEGETVVSDEHVFAEPEAQICDEDLSGESVISNEEIYMEPEYEYVPVGSDVEGDEVDSEEDIDEVVEIAIDDDPAENVSSSGEVSGESVKESVPQEVQVEIPAEDDDPAENVYSGDSAAEETEPLGNVQPKVPFLESAELLAPEEKDSNLSSSTEKMIGSHVKSEKDLESNKFYIQIAVLSDEENIAGLIKKYKKYTVVLVPCRKGYKVLVGPLSVDEYGVVLERFRAMGFMDAFVKSIR